MADLLKRFRAWIVHLLLILHDEPAGTIAPDRTLSIDDGVDYSLPLVVPEWLQGEARDKFVKAALTEASSVYHFQFDRPYLYSENLSQFPTADPLREWDAGGMGNARREVLARCHLAYERNPMANTAVQLTTLFAMGDGLTISYQNKDVETIVEEFRNNPENGIQTYEKTLCNDLQVDGELFIRLRSDGSGQTLIQPLKPWEVWWIQHERGFPKRREFYHWVSDQVTGVPGDVQQVTEDLPAKDMIHVAINQHSYELRGRPELFRILPWLKAYKDWLEGRARQNHWRGALLWDVTLEGADANKVAAKRAQYKQPPPPGSMTIHNDKEKWQPLDSKVGSADVSEDGRQIKLMTAIGKKLPEYMLSDGQNANLASSSSQQLPALRAFSDFQDVMLWQVWYPVYRRVIENAIAAGTLPETVEEQDADGDPILDDAGQTKKIKAVDAFTLSGPEIETDDPKSLAEAMQIAETQEWASKETAAGRMGFDYRIEKKTLDRERQEQIAAGAQGRGMPPEQAGGPTLADFVADGAAAPIAASVMEASPFNEGDGMVSVRMPQPVINVTTPEPPPTVVNVTLPEQPPARITVNVPRAPAPVVNVAAPGAPIVNLPPETGSETLTIERDAEGKIMTIRKEKS